MRKFLLSVFVVLVTSGSACAEVDPNTAAKSVDTTSTEGVRIIPAASKWYVGFNLGFGRLAGWSMGSVNSYYQSVGYENTSQSMSDQALMEVKFYAANRVKDSLDVELGYTSATNYGGNNWSKYRNAANNQIVSERQFNARAISLSALFRPYEGKLFLRGGAHFSEFEIQKSVTGTPANLNAIAAGDRMEGDGVSRGFGTLFGFGFDFKTGKVGAIRLEVNHYFRLGGTRYEKSALDLGYQVNF